MAKFDDPRFLRAIAHPARNRILSELQAGGPLRAADVARTLDIPANQASFHLRQLAKYGLVEEAPEEARDKRDRVWRMVEESITISASAVRAEPGGEAAYKVYQQSARAWGHQLVDRVFAAHGQDEGAQVVAGAVLDNALRLTRDEFTALLAELDELQQRWRDRTRGRGDGRVTYSLYQLLQPHPDAASSRELPEPGMAESDLPVNGHAEGGH